MKKTRRVGKLTLHRETLRRLTPSEVAAAQGGTTGGYTETCPLSGCYVCTGLGCTNNCPDDTTIEIVG